VEQPLIIALIGQRNLRDELKSWKEPLKSLSAQVAEINDTTKRTLVVAEGSQDLLRQMESRTSMVAEATGQILSGKTFRDIHS
jgi:hypothetical protein